jgi:hypothetical protein
VLKDYGSVDADSGVLKLAMAAVTLQYSCAPRSVVWRAGAFGVGALPAMLFEMLGAVPSAVAD